MEDGFTEGRVQQVQRRQARQRCASAPARRAPGAKPRPAAHASPLAVKGRALQHNNDGDAGAVRAIPMPPRQSSPGIVCVQAAARPRRRTEGRGSDNSAADALDHPALPRIRTTAADGPPGKRHLPGSRDELRALFRAYNLPVPHALPPPPHRASAAGGDTAARPVSGLRANGAQQARPYPAAHPYHQRLRGLLDANSHGVYGAAPMPGRRTSLNHDRPRGTSAYQRASKQQAIPGLAAAAAPAAALVAAPRPGRHLDGAVELLPLVLGRPVEVNQGRPAVLPGGGGQAGSRAGQGRAAALEHQPQPEEAAAAADEHEHWDWVYRGPPTPESPYGSDILRAMLDVISPRFEVRRPDGYIPMTPSSIASSRYVRSDVWSWSCPSSPAVGLRPAPEGATDTGAAAAGGGGGGGGANGIGRSPFAAARPSPARPTPRHSSPEPLHRKLLLRAAAAAVAAAGGAPLLSRQEPRQGSASAAASQAATLQAATPHDRGRSLTPPGSIGWNPSLRLRAEHHEGHLMPHWVAAGRASQGSHDLASVQAPSCSPLEPHEQGQVLAAPRSAQHQSQLQPVGYSPGPTPPHGKSRFYQQQQHHHQPPSHEDALAQITPRQQVGTAALPRRVSEGGVPCAARDWHPSVGMHSNRSGATPPTRDLCTPSEALQLPHLPQRGSSAGRFSRAAAMASPVQGLRADGSHLRQLAFVTPSPAGPGLRPRGTPGGCFDLLWEPPPIQPSRALDRHRSGSCTPSPECTIRGEFRERVREAAGARLQQAAAVLRSRRPSSSPSPLPSVPRAGSGAGAAPAVEDGHTRPQQPYRSSIPSARRALYRPDGPSPSFGPAPRSTSACMHGRAAHQSAAISILEGEAAVRPRSSPAARAAAAALARAQHAVADSGGTARSAAARQGDTHSTNAAASEDSASPTQFQRSPLRYHGSGGEMTTRTRPATDGTAFSFRMGAAATGAVDTSVDSWHGAATPALCKAAARPISWQSRQGRRQWALPVHSAPSSPRVQLFPVPVDDGSSPHAGPPAASSPSFVRCGSGIRTPGTPGSHRKRYGSHGSMQQASLRMISAQRTAAAAGSAACLHTAGADDASSSPFTTPRELSSDAAAPGSGSDCGGAPSTGAMVGSSVDSWGTCLAAALPSTAQQQLQHGVPVATDVDTGSCKLHKLPQPHQREASRAGSAVRSRVGPLSPAAALAQRSRCTSLAVRPGLRGSSPATVSPPMGRGPVGEATTPMSPLRQPQPSKLTAGGAAAVDGVRRNLLSSFRSASVGRPASSPEAGGPSTSGTPPRCPAPRPSSSGQPLASGVCPAPPQPRQRFPSAQQTRRRQWEGPGRSGSAQLQEGPQPLAPTPLLAPSVPSAQNAASPSRQAKHGDTRCDQDVGRPAPAGRTSAGQPPAGGFAPQPPLAPRDSLAPRRPSTSGSIRSSKESMGAACNGTPALAASMDDDVAAGQVDARTAPTPQSAAAPSFADQRLAQHAHPQRSILDSPDVGPKKARPSADGAYLTPAGVSSRPASAASRCSSAGASDSSRGRHWSYRRARERALFLNGVLAVAASSVTVGERAVHAVGMDAC